MRGKNNHRHTTHEGHTDNHASTRRARFNLHMPTVLSRNTAYTLVRPPTPLQCAQLSAPTLPKRTPKR